MHFTCIYLYCIYFNYLVNFLMHVVDREPAPATKRAPRRVKATATATLRTMKLTRMVTRRVRAQKVKEKDKNAGQDSIVASQCHGVCLCCSLCGSLMRR